MQVDLSLAKPHPKDRAVELDDPMDLQAFEVSGDPQVMLRMLVEEYARMGWALDEVMALFRDPFYVAAHGLWLLFGEEELRRRISQVLARCGIVRTTTKLSTPASERLVQIELPASRGQGERHA
jgi:hypothetical protein